MNLTSFIFCNLWLFQVNYIKIQLFPIMKIKVKLLKQSFQT
ncbi:hypothetical protein DYY67_2219 [Candidatus Nitrosotalea sp. TS]|nr:hypothetical protein [Candidatus Nitrosotalea sp. TS]